MKISIYNFKSIGSIVEYELKPFTILSGTNSSGKSSFIQLLLLLKQTIELDSGNSQINLKGDLFQVKTYLDIIKDKSISNKLEVVLKFDKDELNNVRSSPEIGVFNSFEYSCKIKILFDYLNGKEFIREFYIGFELSEGDKKEQFIQFINSGKDFSIITNTGVFGDLLYFHPETKIIKINFSSIYPSNFECIKIEDNGQESQQKIVPKIDGIIKLVNGFFKNIRYIGPLREQPKDEYSIKGENNYVGSKGEYLAEVLENHSNDPIEYLQFHEIDGLVKYKLVKSKLIEAIKYWICDVFKLSSDVFATKIDESYTITLVNSSKIKITIKHVGFGISQILPIIVEGLRLPKNATLILEQPEIHLHPKIQSLLFDFLNSLVQGGKSVIIETHSDHLITRMRRRIAEDETNTLKNKINLTFIESRDDEIIFKNIDLDDFGAIKYFPKDFIERPDIELKAILTAQMKKRLKK